MKRTKYEIDREREDKQLGKDNKTALESWVYRCKPERKQYVKVSKKIINSKLNQEKR